MGDEGLSNVDGDMGAITRSTDSPFSYGPGLTELLLYPKAPLTSTLLGYKPTEGFRPPCFLRLELFNLILFCASSLGDIEPRGVEKKSSTEPLISSEMASLISYNELSSFDNFERFKVSMITSHSLPI